MAFFVFAYSSFQFGTIITVLVIINRYLSIFCVVFVTFIFAHLIVLLALLLPNAGQVGRVEAIAAICA